MANMALTPKAVAIVLFPALVLMLTGPNEEVRDTGRLLLGWMLGSIAAGFYESKLSSPSNIAIFLTVMASVVLTRTRVIVRAMSRRRRTE